MSRISGHIKIDGKPIAGIYVALTDRGNAGPHTYTDRHGYYLFTSVPDADYTLATRGERVPVKVSGKDVIVPLVNCPSQQSAEQKEDSAGSDKKSKG